SSNSGARAAQLFDLRPSESLEKFAARVTGAEDDIKLTQADWNGRSLIFVEYATSKPVRGGEEVEISDEDRILVALEKIADHKYRKADVTVGEEEGGTAQINAIAFANADKDPARELIVLLSWPVKHYDLEGTLYEVRIFDDLGPGRSEKLTYLE